MYIKWPRIFSRFLSIFARILHERLKLSPNQVSVMSFVTSLIAAGLVYADYLTAAFVVLFISLFLDALDGTIARRYNLESALGRKLELIFDRTAELIIFLAFAAAGYVSLNLVIMAWALIVIMTILCHWTKIDLGFKRAMMFFGLLIGFKYAFFIIIIAQIVAIFLSAIKLARIHVFHK